MAKSSFIFNFKFKALFMTIALFAASQWLCLVIGNIAQEGSKQVVKQKREWAKTKGMFKKEPGQELVLAFGNSKIGAGFYPSVFDESTGHKTISYNMALIGLQLPPHYFMLKDFLSHNAPPDWLLVQYSPAGFDVESFPSFAVQGASIQEVLAYAYTKKNLDVLFNYFFPSRLHWPEVTRYFVSKLLKLMPSNIQRMHKDLYLNKSNANEIYGHNRKHFYESQYGNPEEYHQQILERLRENRGYYWIEEQAAEGGVISEEYLIRVNAKRAAVTTSSASSEEAKLIDRINTAINVDQIEEEPLPSGLQVLFPEYIDDFFALTARYKIKVMIISNYNLSEDGRDETYYPPRPKIPQEIRQLMQKYPNVYYPLHNHGSKNFGYQYFSDPGHANIKGAKKYTQLLAEEFNELRESLE